MYCVYTGWLVLNERERKREKKKKKGIAKRYGRRGGYCGCTMHHADKYPIRIRTDRYQNSIIMFISYFEEKRSVIHFNEVLARHSTQHTAHPNTITRTTASLAFYLVSPFIGLFVRRDKFAKRVLRVCETC